MKKTLQKIAIGTVIATSFLGGCEREAVNSNDSYFPKIGNNKQLVKVQTINGMGYNVTSDIDGNGTIDTVEVYRGGTGTPGSGSHILYVKDGFGPSGAIEIPVEPLTDNDLTKYRTQLYKSWNNNGWYTE